MDGPWATLTRSAGEKWRLVMQPGRRLGPGVVRVFPHPGEGAAIAGRCGPDKAPEVVAQGLHRTEARMRRDLLDRQVRGLGQVAGAGDALPDQPVAGRSSRGVAESPLERSQAHARLLRETADGQILGDVRRQPVEQEGGRAALSVMEGHLRESDWFGGCSMNIADIALYAYTHVADEGGFDLADYPAVRDWLGWVAEQPGHVPMNPAPVGVVERA